MSQTTKQALVPVVAPMSAKAQLYAHVKETLDSSTDECKKIPNLIRLLDEYRRDQTVSRDPSLGDVIRMVAARLALDGTRDVPEERSMLQGEMEDSLFQIMHQRQLEEFRALQKSKDHRLLARSVDVAADIALMSLKDASDDEEDDLDADTTESDESEDSDSESDSESDSDE